MGYVCEQLHHRSKPQAGKTSVAIKSRLPLAQQFLALRTDGLRISKRS